MNMIGRVRGVVRHSKKNSLAGVICEGVKCGPREEGTVDGSTGEDACEVCAEDLKGGGQRTGEVTHSARVASHTVTVRATKTRLGY